MQAFRNSPLKPILTISIIFLFLTSLRLLWLFYHNPPDQPIAHEGVLDLRNYELKEDQTITLNGEWAFSPEAFIAPNLIEEDFSKNQWKMQSVPSKGNEDAAYRFGTYRLKIILDKNQVHGYKYGIRIPSAKTASALFINGELEAKSGEPANNSRQHKGRNTPYVVSFKADQQEIDIVIHISNFDTPENPSLHKSITFGLANSIIKEHNMIKISVLSVAIVLLIHSLYTILICIFIYRDKIVLFFTAGFLFPAIDEIFTYNQAAFEWLHLNYHWSLKLSHLIYLGSSFFFVQFMRVLLTKYRGDKSFRLFTILYGFCALSIIIMPTDYLLPANTLFFLLYLLSFTYVVIFALKEYVQNHGDSFFLAFTAISTTSGIIWGMIKTFSGIEIPFYPFDYMFAFLGFAAFWFKRYDKKNVEADELVNELRKADKLKDDFLTNSSKKLWRPLNEMITIAQTIYDGKRSSFATQDKNDLKYLINIGRSMSFVLKDLLDFTRLKEQTILIHPSSTNVHATVATVFDMLRYIIDGKQVQMKSTVPSSFPNVFADENRLIQILFNLLYNAIKYTDEGSIVVNAEIRNGMAVIHVRDSGIGINEETQKRILSPYEQVMANDEGIGLGLSVCKQLIELHGGTLHIESALEQGSDFYFTLPLAKERITFDKQLELNERVVSIHSSGRLRQQESQTQKVQFRILAVDDDPVSLKVISNIFPSEQYDVVTATSGKEALSLLDKAKWDLIIVDAVMPHMSGYELLRSIRKQYSVLEVPILLLTARSYPEDVYTGLSLGANDYVVKPINSLELKSRGQALIEIKHAINERLSMEAAWLQAQIHPHFLFNTLNTIASLSAIDSERMIGLLIEFGEYLRRSFQAENLKQFVSLEHELELVRSYLYIEKERFGERLQVIWEVDETIEIELPPLTIQPLVENAVQHGVLNKLNGGAICIRITEQQGFKKVAIIDNGVGISEEKLNHIFDETNKNRSGVGLINTNRRLKRIYGHGLEINSFPNKGTEVSFKIPKKEKDGEV